MQHCSSCSCCGHFVSPFLPARATFVADTKNVSDFVQKHFVSATNVSQFAQHGNTTFISCPARLRPGSDADLFMSRTQFEFGPTQINKITPVDSDAVLFGHS